MAVALGLLLGVVTGCGDKSKYAPVSGVVKLNGKPYPNAAVFFQPLGGKDNPNPGRGSSGVTDENGRFTLLYDGSEPGAVVGKHYVRISTVPGSGVKEPPPEEGSPDGVVGARAELEFDPIPVEWNEKSEKTFEVPPGGTDQANFDITSDPVVKGKKGKKK